jgi:hypothetical protein
MWADDEEYQRIQAEEDIRLALMKAEITRAEQPLTDDLHAAGIDVKSVWRLKWPYPEALPVLVKHLERGGYPEVTMSRIGNALAVKPAVAYWDRLRACYLAADDPDQANAAAIALSECATSAQLDDLIGFLDLEERGQSRIFFLRPIRRLGRKKVQGLLESLQSDPVLGAEATAILKGRSPND